MGKSKFPGKPSKSVMKERVRVLNKNENQKTGNVSPRQSITKSKKCIYSDCCTANPVLPERSNNLLKKSSESKPARILLQDGNKIIAEGYDCGKGHIQKSCTNNDYEDEERKITYAALGSQSRPRDCSGLDLNCSSTDLEKLIKKKTVTFKNVLETSDDTSKKSRIHNPLNKGPLISIMKKECTSSQRYVLRGDSIVRPSRLTEILKNSENIDKTNSLSFRTVQISNALKKQKLEATTHKLSKETSSGKECLIDKRPICASESQKQNFQKVEKLLEINNCKSLDKWKVLKTSVLGNEVNRKCAKKKDGIAANKIVLRQPRLYFEPQNDMALKGKHDAPTTSDRILLSPLSCIYSACGVCNSTISNKTPQNRKYGIIACDACRKFISKITKKTISSPTSPLTAYKIQCNKRDGECAISCPPKNTVKSFKKINDERCSACWLKKCVNTFHFSSGHKLRLNAILSETHKIKTETKSKSLLSVSPSISNYKNEISAIECNQSNSKTTELSWTIKSSHSPDLLNGKNTDLTMDIWLQPKSYHAKVLSGDSVVGMNSSNSIMSKKTQTIIYPSSELMSANLNALSAYPKRQKIDFKGPRVKHVCRSASIALGQQIARFSNEDENRSNLSKTNSDTGSSSLKKSLFGNIYNFSKNVSGNIAELRKRLEVDKNDLQPLNIRNSTPQSKSLSASTDSLLEAEHSVDSKNVENNNNDYQFQKSTEKTNGNRKAFMLTRHGLGSLAKRNLMRMTKVRGFEKKSKLISIEFWDNYIPAEVNETGFGIILTETFPIFALCFLCGSMDLENLRFCASCCEPYHSYCIQEDTFRDKNKYIDAEKTENLLNKLNWVCPRCTVCYTCNMSSGSKIKCQKCKKNYHSTCMGTSKGLPGADRPLICRSCLKCQTCFTSKVSKYVGSQPICMQCFKMSKSESRCPLCNNTFDDILDITILKCGVCKKFIHGKCEGLTEVQSNLQSNLPENIKFACKKCSLESDYAKNLANNWREAVVEELKYGLLDILKLLSRSRQANLLKKSKNKYKCDFENARKCCKNYSIDNDENEIIENGQDNVFNIFNGYTNYLHSNSKFYRSNAEKSLSLYDIRKKVMDKKYITLFDFNADMNDVILSVKNDELILTYKEILSEKFSWFQNETKTCTDALEEDMFESNYFFQVDDVVTEDLNATLKLPESARQVLDCLNEKKDNRPCILCKKQGDGGYLHESRLLYCGFNTWVHANCIIWSNDVYEEFDGTIQNVNHAITSGRLTKCGYCNLLGATIGCSFNKCCNFFHFSCAIKSKCLFTSDKSVRCSNHNTKYNDMNIVENKDVFNVYRPLYVDFDNSIRKYVEPCKVQFMLGSLAVVQLGSICPKFSDTSEAIVPINFICTRLYWSSKEPWKIVKYKVRTSIQHLSLSIDNDIGKHFTVDHSQNGNLVEKQLSQISSWQNALTREENLDCTLHRDFRQFGNLRLSADDDNFNETNSDECVEEEPQNNSDLLPPEIKDAIFEDLPHDILDGISMLDIFPKLMIYEDILTVDAKAENSNETCDNSGIQSTGPSVTFNFLNKQEPTFSNHIEDINTINIQSMYPKCEFQSSNPDGFLRNVEGYRNQQRSPSHSVNCKFDNVRGYLPKRFSESGLNEIQSCNAKIKSFDSNSDNCRGNLKKQKLKLIQLDGTDDILLSHPPSRCENTKNKPVSCDRCHCTYRTFDSFQRHLLNCEQMSTSESETESFSKSPIDINSSTLGNLIKNSIPIQNHIKGNQDTTDLTVVTKSSLISKPVMSQNDDVISLDYHEGLLVNSNTTAGDALKLYNSNNIGEPCDENRWEHGSSVELGVLNKSKKVNCNFNFANINNKIKNEQFKDYSSVKAESTVIPEPLGVNKTEYTSSEKHNHLQFLNQHLVLNNQFAQKEEQTQQQQFFVIQQSNNQPLFIHQVSNAQTIPQNIFPVVLSNNSVQYTSVQPSTNPLMQGSIFQTDASGNILISSGLQMLSMPPLQLSAQSSPQLIGTFNQLQPLHLGQNQMFIGGTATMDLLPNSNQVLLTTSPVYYGLETIVQNTVMSSQQFVSTAMQGVLSQNASFSATTTQVFQSSKFEPVNETQSSYVVLNNTDGTAIVVPQTNVLTGFMNTSTDYQSAYSHDFGNICSTHHQTFIQEPQSNNVMPIMSTLSDISSVIETPISQIQSAVNLERNSHITSSRKLTVKLTSSINDLSSKNAINLSKQNVSHESVKIDNLMKKVNSSTKVNHKIIKRSKAYKLNQVNSNPDNINLQKNSVSSTQLKDVSVRDGIDNKIESSDKKSENDVPCLLVNANNKCVNNCNHYLQSEKKNFEDLTNTSKCAQDEKKNSKRIPQITNNKSLSKLYSINSLKLPPTSLSFSSSLNNVPTNIVAPIVNIQQNSNTTARPTNRVLPMQSIHKRSTDELKSKNILKNILNKFLDNSSLEIDEQKKKSEDINVNIQQKFELSTCLTENNTRETSFYANIENDNIQVDSNKNEDNFLWKTKIDDVNNSNLLHRTKGKENDEISVVGHNVISTDYHILPHDRTFSDNEIRNTKENVEKSKYTKCTSLTDGENNQYQLAATIPKKGFEVKGRTNEFEPHLIYEIQSEDGFSYKSESIADVWETVFEAVQSARRAHGLPSLPIGPFADMCGIQMIGLKTNALKYLVEQLPGIERCTKYIPKYHKHNSVRMGNEQFHQEQEKLFENVHGAVRCEPFTKKSDYDIFSWLASKHRKQPKQIFVQPLDTELIARRCNTTLPMAMKYRTLKETCKQNVGVFRSLIHGRGLFCTKDIEAGEMVIEYAGELIRSTLTDKRERIYDTKGIGCYMFKIDENFVVDATMRGNAARFINHSCEPNCYSRVVDILGHKHIIIFSLRRIVQGEELTYDYKFPFEDVKIPCSCGSKKCRRYLN